MIKKLLTAVVIFTAICTQAQTTLNTLNNFTDFTVTGIGAQPITQATNPFGFTSNGWSTYTFSVNKTYTSTVVFDSIVAKYDLFAYYQFPAALSVNSSSLNSGTSAKKLKVTNTNSIPLLFNVVFADSSTELRFTNLSVIGYIGTVGLVDLNNSNTNNVRVYPNPSNNEIFFDEPADISLADLTGKVLYSENNISHLNLSMYECGVYFLTLTINDQKQTHKIVKQ